MGTTGFPGHSFSVVGAIRNRNDHPVVVERIYLPQVISGHRDCFTGALEGKRRGRCHATVIQDDAPVACLTVFRFKLGGILEVDNERGVRDREGTIIVIGTRSETGNGERTCGEEA